MADPSDHSGSSPDGGSPDGLPDLPAEWGVIVVPDDLSELEDEVRAIRAELRPPSAPTAWQRLGNRPALRTARRLAAATLRAPVMLMSLAMLVTVASLFASAWPAAPRQPATQRTGTEERGTTLPALELIGAAGQNVPLRGQLPAAILLVERCECAQLVAGTINGVRPQTTVIAVVAGPATTAAVPVLGPAPQAQGKSVLVLHDPTGELRRQLDLAPPDASAAAVLLVDQSGEIIRKIARIADVTEIEPDLARL